MQFGISPNKELMQKWQRAGNIKDDPKSSIPFTDGIVSYAGYGADSRMSASAVTALIFAIPKKSLHLTGKPMPELRKRR